MYFCGYGPVAQRITNVVPWLSALKGPVAQRIEQFPSKEKVVSSILTRVTHGPVAQW